ncbi:MAG: DUF1015 domain-containing protein [Planctomycetaceae bacterium]|nr:DUF1015 domain-containing protein [Planctomycetaceae bacterium]
MPKIQAFPGLRYDLGHVGSLSDVIAPPYDVIDDKLRDSLYEKHPANVIRLILNREEPGDDEQSNCYTRAARFLKNWRSEGVLEREADPAIYVYHQSFEVDGQPLTRRGFMCRTRLEKFGEGTIYPHEETHASAKEDRLKLTRACQANLSQIFGLFPDPEGEAQNLLEAHITTQQPIEATDHLGVIHRIWPVTDVNVIAQVSALMDAKPVFIADGHHRYETACNFREELREKQGIDENHPANSVLMMCVGMNDPGMIVLPTHRLFREMPAMTSSELIEKLGDRFECQVAGDSPEQAESIWSEIETENEQGTIGLFTAKDRKWVLARITQSGRDRMKEIATEHSSDWQGLGVSILHRLIVEELLGQTKLPKPKYVHLVSELQDGLASPDEFSLAALVMPATLDHIRAISQHGERMPAKSTYFYPKLLSGLVINPLD